MAKKVILKDLNNIEILPISRGELILDSSGKLAFRSNEFLATNSLPGLMSKEDKAKLDRLNENGPTIDLVSATADGLAPKIGTVAASTVTTQADEWVLTSTKGATPTWRKLPTNAFLNYYRPILVNGTSLLGNDNTALNIVAGNNINLTTAAGKVTINNAGVRSVTIGTGENNKKLAVDTNGTITNLTIPFATESSYLLGYYTLSIKQYLDVSLKWYINIVKTSDHYAGDNTGFPANDNSNGILWLGTHSQGPYGGQLGVSSNSRLYYRYITAGSFPTTANGGSWNKIAWTSEIPTKLSQLTNDSGYLTNSSLSNYVTLNTDLTITGWKIFSNNVELTPYSDHGTYSLVFRTKNHGVKWLSCIKGDLKFGNSDDMKKVWHAGNDGSGSGLDADKVDGYQASSLLEGAYKVSGAISVSSAGWYKIAAYSTTGYLPRGSIKFIISITGGSYTPGTVEFYGDMSWSWTDTFYSFGYNPYGLKVRFGKDANYTYVEVYFRLAITSSCYLYVPYSASSMSIQNNAWTWYTGALSASVATSYSGSTNGASGFVWGTNMYAAHFYENSDVRLKTNITDITSSDNIPLLKSFDWKSDGTRGYGLIAQELEELGYSELVSGELDGIKTVNYSAALSLIVGKLQVKIKELEKEIEILKSK